MKTLLINSSPRGERSHSLALAQYAAQRVGGELTVRDLPSENPPFVRGMQIAHNYGFAAYSDLSGADKDAVDAQSSYLADVLSADTLIIAAPMWNFSMPASLKAWFDLICVVNKSFKIENGEYVGLLTNIHRAIIVGARGGVPAGVPWDHLDPQIKALLEFLGIMDVHTHWIVGRDAAAIAPEMEKAKAEIDTYLSV